MPSWVLPAVAAELWGVPVEQVLADIASGRAPSRVEGEFLFVDIDPCSEVTESAPRLPYRRSLAWTPVQAEPLITPAEREALLEESEEVTERFESNDADELFAEIEDAPIGDAPAPLALTEDDTPDWEAVRSRVSRMRRPPAMRDAA